MDMPDFEGWFDSLNLDPKSVGFAFIITLWMAISMFDDPFNTGMNRMPLLARILSVVLIGPVTYFIVDKMTNN